MQLWDFCERCCIAGFIASWQQSMRRIATILPLFGAWHSTMAGFSSSSSGHQAILLAYGLSRKIKAQDPENNN